MKNRTEWTIATVIIICLVTFVGLAQAQEADESGKKLEGEVRFRYNWLGVRKDRGRFREDNWITDRSTGGLDWLHIESTEPDENGYEWLLEGRALYDYDYDLSILMKKQDSHYLKLDFSSLRRYFDGSNEYWRPSGVNLAERSDGGLFVDRKNYNIELGLTPPEGPHWVFGWHRLEKDGKEVLLHGANASTDSVYGIPTVLDVRGITDTIYGEFSQTFAEKYNFRFRQEFEQYHSDRYQNWQYRDSTGAIVSASSGDISDDDLGYTNWRTMLMFDSFLDDKTYVTANYMYNYLNSNSTQNNLIATKGSHPHDYKTVGGGISRRTNVGGLSYRRTDILQIPRLDFSAGVRLEDSKTSGSSSYITATSSTPTKTESTLDEVRVAEVLRLVYKGIEKTTLSFDADLEQRDLDWYGDYSGSASNLDRKADTDFLDQVYTFKAVHRFNRAVKSTVKFRIKDLERSLTNLFRGNTNPDDYPGWLGNYRRTGQDLTVKTDFRINSKTSSTLMYQYVHEAIDFELGGKTSNQEIHRGTGSLSFSPRENLFLVGTFMLENYDLDTAAVGTGSQAFGSRPYDFRGNSYSLLVDSTYAFNEKTSATLNFQHTEATGTVDRAGDYVFDKVGLTLKHRFAANQTIGLGYQFYNFNNHAGRGDFDDYRAHGMFATYSYTF